MSLESVEASVIIECVSLRMAGPVWAGTFTESFLEDSFTSPLNEREESLLQDVEHCGQKQSES